MAAKTKVLVVVPCYNEAGRFDKSQFESFIKSTDGYKVLFVDDGSTDGTFDILNLLKQNEPERFDVLRLAQNSGKAEAVRQGFLKGLAADADFIAYWDADLAVPLHVLPSFLITFNGRPQTDFIIGSRVKLMGHDIKRNEFRHYLGRIFATAASWVLKLPVYDTQCGAKMFRVTHPLAKLFQEPFHSRWIFDVELIARYARLKKSYGETDMNTCAFEFPLPIWHDIKGSKLRARDFFKSFFELFRIYFRYR